MLKEQRSVARSGRSGFARVASAAVFLALLSGCSGGPSASPGAVHPAATAAALGSSIPGFTANATPLAAGFRIVGYVTDGDVVVSQIQFDKVTHLNYAFLIPHADGTFADIANSWKLDEIVAKAHATGVRVMISVGGWGWDPQFEAMASDPATRATFVTGLVRFVDDHLLDGADIDWEYPDPGTSGQNYLALMRELRGKLPQGQKLLTSAVVARGTTGSGIVAEAFELVDFLNVMAYDGPGPNHSSFAFAQESLAYWAARGLPGEKTVLGVPFYSRPGEVPYRKLVKTDPAAANADEIDYSGDTVYYNGLPTIRDKTRLAMGNASGIMIWTLAQDTSDGTSLLTAIYETAHP